MICFYVIVVVNLMYVERKGIIMKVESTSMNQSKGYVRRHVVNAAATAAGIVAVPAIVSRLKHTRRISMKELGVYKNIEVLNKFGEHFAKLGRKFWDKLGVKDLPPHLDNIGAARVGLVLASSLTALSLLFLGIYKAGKINGEAKKEA